MAYEWLQWEKLNELAVVQQSCRLLMSHCTFLQESVRAELLRRRVGLGWFRKAIDCAPSEEKRMTPTSLLYRLFLLAPAMKVLYKLRST